jgi:hypothetical protein
MKVKVRRGERGFAHLEKLGKKTVFMRAVLTCCRVVSRSERVLFQAVPRARSRVAKLGNHDSAHGNGSECWWSGQEDHQEEDAADGGAEQGEHPEDVLAGEEGHRAEGDGDLVGG